MNNFYKNFVGYCVGSGGDLDIIYNQGIISSQYPSICNSTVYNDNNKILTNIRNVNFIQHFERENKISQCYYGSLCYITRDDDNKLRTINYLGEINEDLDTLNVRKFNIKETECPQFEMVGVEDIRLVRWDGILYGIGCNRDFDKSGYCQMVMIEINEEDGSEKRRIYINNPEGAIVEKNWVPIIDKPYHFMRWFNPMQIVKVNPLNGEIEIVLEKEFTIEGIDYNDRRLRGSSQIIPYKDMYIGIIHTVELELSKRGDKRGRYLHQFLIWDKEFNLINYSSLFNFSGNESEFCVGICEKDNNFYIPYSVNDGIQYILKVSGEVLFKFINKEFHKIIKNESLCRNIHEKCAVNSSWLNYYYSGLEFFNKRYYSASYSNFCRSYRELYYITETNKTDKELELYKYILLNLEGLSLAYSEGRLLTELYTFQSAVLLNSEYPEAYYFISNYYLWRGYPELAVMYGKLAYDRISNRVEQNNVLTDIVSNEMITLHYIKLMWYTPDFEKEIDELNKLKNDSRYYYLINEINREINRIKEQEEINKKNIIYFGK